MDIILTYKTNNRDEILSLKLSINQYYDLTDIQKFEEVDVPKYNDMREYISNSDQALDVKTIEWTKIIFSNSQKSDGFILTKYFPNNSLFVHRKDLDGYELIINDIQVSENCVVVTRMDRPNIESDWENISYSIGSNINGPDERWVNPLKGEQTI